MADFYDSTEGAGAYNSETADYSGSDFSYPINGQFEAYYVTRYADAASYSAASLTGNSVVLSGSANADQVFVNVDATATDVSSAISAFNYWYVELGDGDDASVIHTLAAGIDPGTVVSVSHDSATLIGGAGADTLQTTQYLNALNEASVSIESTSRSIDGGEGFDTINAELTLDVGEAGFAGGIADYFDNSLFVNAGADGANIYASNFLTAVSGGLVTGNGNSFTLLGGPTGHTFINGGTVITAGTADLSGGTVNWSSNSFYASAGAEGGEVYAQNSLAASWDGFVSFSDNSFTLSGEDRADHLSAGVSFTGGSIEDGISGGAGEVLNNSFLADGGAGDDVLDFFLLGATVIGGSVSMAGNSFSLAGGEGNDTINLDWGVYVDGGSAELSGNSATLDGGAGCDTLNAYLGDVTNGSSVTLFGGDGNDFIETIDLGQNNVRLISGGAGDDTIIDDSGFSTVQFGGARADYTISSLPGGWISVTDNRDGSPDGADQLYQVDQLHFGDGDVLVADLALPITGTEADDTLFGSDGDDVIYGYGGNDILWGNAGNDALNGGSGNDTLIGLAGNDTLLGGDGNDQLIGNSGADELTGGAGADKFSYGALFQSPNDAPDLITDFSGQTVLTTNGQGRAVRTPGEGDKIDLSTLDANVSLAGDQAFTLVQHRFSGKAGEAYSSYDAGTGLTSVYLDVDGDAHADMTIQLSGHVNLTGADFIL